MALENPWAGGVSNQQARGVGLPTSGDMKPMTRLPPQRQQAPFANSSQAPNQPVAGMQPAVGTAPAVGAAYQMKPTMLSPQATSFLRSHQVMQGMVGQMAAIVSPLP